LCRPVYDAIPLRCPKIDFNRCQKKPKIDRKKSWRRFVLYDVEYHRDFWLTQKGSCLIGKKLRRAPGWLIFHSFWSTKNSPIKNREPRHKSWRRFVDNLLIYDAVWCVSKLGNFLFGKKLKRANRGKCAFFQQNGQQAAHNDRAW
jgi:hypothetical protein